MTRKTGVPFLSDVEPGEAMNDDDAVSPDLQPTGGTCPICKAKAVRKFRPFCSGRCADVDLGRWMTGRYAIPGGDADEDEDGEQALAEALARRERGRTDDAEEA